jgi:hypothetical protein
MVETTPRALGKGQKNKKQKTKKGLGFEGGRTTPKADWGGQAGQPPPWEIPATPFVFLGF